MKRFGKRGDGMAEFERVYGEYFDVVYGYVLRLCRDPSLAEEVTQEAFFKALKAIDGFRGDCRLDVWLCQIAKNVYFDLAKKRRRRGELPAEDALPSPENLAVRLEDRETAFAVHRALHRLDEPYREVFWLRVFGELDFQRIASLFGKTESWARVTYHRAQLKIRENMEENGNDT